MGHLPQIRAIQRKEKNNLNLCFPVFVRSNNLAPFSPRSLVSANLGNKNQPKSRQKVVMLSVFELWFANMAYVFFPIYRRWITTPWSDCSRSCGNGHQTRKVQCITDLTSTKSTPSNKCSNANKPVENDTLQSCNSFDCYPDWDTKDGFDVRMLRWED